MPKCTLWTGLKQEDNIRCQSIDYMRTDF